MGAKVGEIDPGVITFARAGFQMLWSPEDAARKFLGVSPDTLERWTKEGLISRRKGNPGDSRANYYTLPDLLDFVARMPKG